MKKALLIVNPFSGKKNGERLAAGIRHELDGRGISTELFVSRHIGAMNELITKTDLKDSDFVGLVGGDGTMHAFLNAALSRYTVVPVPVALFPCGTGNAFNLDIGCNSIDQTLAAIYANERADIDVAEVKCGDRIIWSFNIIGCGLVEGINRLAEDLRWLGSSRYTAASLIRLLVNPKTHLRIITDQGVLEGKFSFVLACNTRYTGKGMMMAPHARLNDGKFDVTVVKACSALTLLRLFPKIFRGAHLNADVIHYMQTGSLQVNSGTTTLPTNIDGEITGQVPFSLVVHQNRIKVFMKR